jgi:GAF domain-containing protein
MLADEHDALRRLATAVAHNVPPAEIFRAVAEEIRPLLDADEAAVVRFEARRHGDGRRGRRTMGPRSSGSGAA